jgi:DNA-binding transcriptional MerR regulator/methylmalonyl-CoA mutase cobalamin-binding subunit
VKALPDTYIYTLAQVAALTGVPKQTLHAWERRYGLLQPSVLGSRRLYSNRQISRIRLLRECVEQGKRISSLVGLDNEELRRLLRRGTLDAVKVDKLLGLVEEMRPAELDRELGLHLLSMGTTLFMEELIAPLMQEVGRKWEQGRLPVVAEHFVTAAVSSLVTSVLRLSSGRSSAPRALFATLEDEQHEIGLLAAALIAADHGIDPMYLGSCIPLADLPHAALKTGANIVVLGATVTEPGVLAQQIERLRHLLPEEVSLFIGGEACQNLERAPPSGAALFPSLSDLDTYLGQKLV